MKIRTSKCLSWFCRIRARICSRLVACRIMACHVMAIAGMWWVIGQSHALGQPEFAQNAQAMAVAGEPFGVLVFEVQLPADWAGQQPRVFVQEESDRIFYPVIVSRTTEVRLAQEPLPPPLIGRPGGVIDRFRNVLRPPGPTKQVPVAVQVFALFRGNQPLSVRLYGEVEQQIQLPAITDRETNAHSQLLNSWWVAFVNEANRQVAQPNTNHNIPLFLTSMLARRLGLPPVELQPSADQSDWFIPLEDSKPQFLETIELMSGAEPLRAQIARDLLRQPTVSSPEELPLPPEPYWMPTELPWVDTEVDVETLAMRVPPECFYLRFGSFANYLWFQDLGQRFAGDLANAVWMSGLNYGGMARTEKMLATRTTTVSRMFGDQLIKDMALFGNDLYFNDGASMGVLFQTTNAALLKASFDSDRKALMAENPDAELSELTLAGRKVSLLSTPDNRIRAFLLADGDFVVITTSQRLLERLVQISEGQPSLANSETFRWVRGRMPHNNDYSVFGYFSPEFFQNLLGPQYQIELRRRMLASAHLEYAEIASRVALFDGQGVDGEWVDGEWVDGFDSGIELSQDLKAMREAMLLPAWFDERADGARLLRSGDSWIDSLRGGRGSFLPIADVEVASVSQEEAAEYAKVAEFYQKQWGRMDPLFFGLRRFQSDEAPPEGSTQNVDGMLSERLSIEAYLAPFEPQKYGWIFQQLADPNSVAVTFPSDDMVSVQLRVRGTLPTDSYYLFGGLKDMLPPDAEQVQGLIKSLRALKTAPAYLGAWPKPDIIQNLPLGIGSRLAVPDFAGYSRMVGGLWRWQSDQWSLLSFHRNILDSTSRQIGLEESTDSAQIRISMADFQGSKIAEWIDRLWWEKSWKSSLANAQLLDNLHQHLRVPSEQCPQVAERILDAKLQCSLDGQYFFQPVSTDASQIGWWESTAWAAGEFSPSGKPLPPPEYTAPWLKWFRGAQIHATQQPQSLSIVGMVNVDLPPISSLRTSEESAKAGETSDLLPMQEFNVFELPLKMFGSKKSDKEPPVESLPKRQNF